MSHSHDLYLCVGRDLHYSPRWANEGYSVIFDANSGDYWVVSDAARGIVESIAHGASCHLDEEIVSGLCDAGILERTNRSVLP